MSSPQNCIDLGIIVDSVLIVYFNLVKSNDKIVIIPPFVPSLYIATNK